MTVALNVREVTLPHHAGPPTYDQMPRGTWHKVEGGGLFIRCGGPSCGTAGREPALLACDPHHTIVEVGRVLPSVRCPTCGWHVWATLHRWAA